MKSEADERAEVAAADSATAAAESQPAERADGSSESGPGPELTDAAEMLLRQQHPSLVRDGVPMSPTFAPNKADCGLMSVSRGSLVTPEVAFERHTATKGKRSIAVYGVTVGECHDTGLKAYATPAANDPAHASIDFRGLSRGAVERAAKKLRDVAVARKPLYAPPDE